MFVNFLKELEGLFKMDANIIPTYEEHVYAMQVASLHDKPETAYNLAIRLFDEVNKGERGRPKNKESGLREALESLVLLGKHGSMRHLVDTFFRKNIRLCGRSSVGKSIKYFLENKDRKIIAEDLDVLLTRNYSAEKLVLKTPRHPCYYGATNPNAYVPSEQHLIIESNNGRPPHRKEVDRKLLVEGILES